MKYRYLCGLLSLFAGIPTQAATLEYGASLDQSTWRLTGDKAPHWVVLVGIDEQFVFFHDPDVDSSRDRLASAMQVPVRRDDFFAMMQYGKERFSAALALARP